MKKGLFFCTVGALLLASCANDDLVIKPDVGTDNAPITFRAKVGNISRDGDPALNTQGYTNFGVYALKRQASDASSDNTFDDISLSTSPLVVMNNYKVTYDANTTEYGSNWSYTTTSGQYLKYWDGAYKNTYFFAYGPHSTSSNVNLAFANNEATLTFPAFTMVAGAGNDYIFSDVQVEDNVTHVRFNDPAVPTTLDPTNTTANPITVPLKFHHTLSQVKVAFYEVIPGYTVKMAELTFDGETERDTHQIVAIPADYNATGKTWSKGKYLKSGTPVVTFSTNTKEYDTTSLAFDNCNNSDDNIEFAIPVDDDNAPVAIGTTYATHTPSATVYNVLPNNTNGTNVTMSTTASPAPTYTENSGLQFVMNFDLCAEDTKEVIHVRGARVYVAPDYTAWEPNKVYTYVFRITKATSGTTTTDDPDPDPVDPEGALYPIIFDNITITDMSEGTTGEWDVKPEGTTPADPHDPNIHPENTPATGD